MSPGPTRWRPIVAVGLCVAAAAALFGSGGLWLASMRSDALEVVGEIEPRYARLLGLVRSQPELETRLQQAREVAGRLALPADVELPRAGADLQQLLRKLAEAAGLGVSGTQILPPQVEDGLELVAVTLNVEAEVPGLQRFLAEVAAESPRITVRSMVVQPQGRIALQRPEQKLLVTLEFVRWRMPA